MKAISVRPEHAMDMFFMEKTIEVRSWQTDHRGRLLVCTTDVKTYGAVAGHALYIANLADVVPFEEVHLSGALMDKMPPTPHYAWVLDGGTLIEPFKQRGRLRLFDVDDSLINEIPPGAMSENEYLRKYIEPLMAFGSGEVRKDVQAYWDAILAQ